MSRLWTLIAASVLCPTLASARTPTGSLDELLERATPARIADVQRALDAMSEGQPGWQGRARVADELAEAKGQVAQARAARTEGDVVDAAEHLTRAWRALGPAASAWTAQATAAQQRAFARTLTRGIGDQIALYETYEEVLPADARSALTQASAAHAEATAHHATPREALALERKAFQAMNRCASAVVRAAITDGPAPSPAAPAAGRAVARR